MSAFSVARAMYGFVERSITFYARDPDGNTATETVVISVADAATGASPDVTDPADRSAPAGRLLSIPFAASDPDGDTVAFSAASLPAGAALSPAGVFTWTPVAAHRGTYRLLFLVDGAQVAVDVTVR